MSEVTKVKTGDLIGTALDWAVAKAQGLRVVHYRTWLETEDEYWKGKICDWAGAEGYRVITDDNLTADILSYSIDWAQGGPIIEREKIALYLYKDPGSWQAKKLCESSWNTSWTFVSSSPLIAAMRCYVASKLGHGIEVPSELLQGQSC